MKLFIKQLEGAEDLPLPSYGHEGDAGLDLHASEAVTLAPGERKVIPTGVACEIPHGYVGLVWDKGGIATKYGIKVFGGVFDAPYRGEILVTMTNFGSEAHTFERGDKIAQILIQKVEYAEIEVVDELSKTPRGEDRLGSTGR